MPTGGVRVNDWFRPKEQTKEGSTFNQFGNPQSYTGAAKQQAGDYDAIMKSYADMAGKLKSGGGGSVQSSSVSPQAIQYNKSDDVSAALGNLAGLTKTGGYSEQDKADLRARGISPLRSIYSSAQQGLNRNKALSGGYSPNFAAASAKMARSLSDQIGGAEQSVNAGIAQNVAGNKVAIAPAYASAALGESGQRIGVDTSNAGNALQAGIANSGNSLQAEIANAQLKQGNNRDILSAIEGMKSLYGTTPALTNLFGNQVMQAQGSGQNQQQINNRKLEGVYGSIGRFGQS